MQSVTCFSFALQSELPSGMRWPPTYGSSSWGRRCVGCRVPPLPVQLSLDFLPVFPSTQSRKLPPRFSAGHPTAFLQMHDHLCWALPCLTADPALWKPLDPMRLLLPRLLCCIWEARGRRGPCSPLPKSFAMPWLVPLNRGRGLLSSVPTLEPLRLFLHPSHNPSALPFSSTCRGFGFPPSAPLTPSPKTSGPRMGP